jgi:hypothetical protein
MYTAKAWFFVEFSDKPAISLLKHFVLCVCQILGRCGLEAQVRNAVRFTVHWPAPGNLLCRFDAVVFVSRR